MYKIKKKYPKALISEDEINFKCPYCNLYKSIDYFYKNFSQNGKCRLCYREYKKKYYQRPYVKNKEYDFQMKRKYKQLYGITIDEYQKIYQKQKGLCAICNKKETNIDSRSGKVTKLAVDHCHTTKKVRGLLCRVCNQVLGKFKDDIELFQACINYLLS